MSGGDEPALVKARRERAGVDPAEPAAPIGLALSGGGIRSATFCLGVIRGLARNGQLRRFDYLSTVSGGGYVGSAWGRLYGPGQEGQAVEAGLARDDTLFLWWLRSNGRYLTPAGALDLMHGFASAFRGALATHTELAMLFLVAAAVISLPQLTLQTWSPGLWQAWAAGAHVQTVSPWLWALALPFFTGCHHIFGYWMSQGPRGWRRTLTWAATLASGGLGLFIGVRALAGLRVPPPGIAATALAILAGLVLLSAFSAWVWHVTHGRQTPSQARLAHTKGLSASFWVFGALLLVAAVDWAGWAALRWLARPSATPAEAATAALPAGLVAFAIAVRAQYDRIKQWLEGKDQAGLLKRVTRQATELAMNLAGLVLALGLAVAWLAVFRHLALAVPWTWLAQATGWAEGGAALAWLKWAVLAALPATYLVVTWFDLEMLNLSSMHNFYRARIERAYVACGNASRFAAGAFAEVSREGTNHARSLRESVKGDDIDLVRYAPHVHGGPIHLVNCCINQTVDDRTDNYNADRKGVALTLSSLGVETGARWPAPKPPPPGTLSAWIAVSGAAASSGMGSKTTPGLAALLFLTGLRLGYWQASLLPPENGAAPRQSAPEQPRLAKPQLIQAEGLARFPGLRSPQWYVSDGGHFDNTGIYALLKRRPRLIVAVDCGADPKYAFEDLEDLVRKARIDHRADIAFFLPPAPGGGGAAEMLHAQLGMPGAGATAQGPLLLASVRYAGAGWTEAGTLVVVKPRVRGAMPPPHAPGGAATPPLHIDGYAQRNREFPQEPTGDQFFDEAQWEAYHELGFLHGRLLTAANLKQIEAWAATHRQAKDQEEKT